MRDGQLLEKEQIDKMYALNIIHMIRGLLANLVHSRHIPTVVVQGRYDVVCPVRLSHPP